MERWHYTAQQAADAPLEELLDLQGFGVACAYELVDWLKERSLRNRALDDWVTERAAGGMGDPRLTHAPEDYAQDTQVKRIWLP